MTLGEAAQADPEGLCAELDSKSALERGSEQCAGVLTTLKEFINGRGHREGTNR